MRPLRDLYIRPRSATLIAMAIGKKHARGFTLVEMVVVITIAGIVAAGVALFIRLPVQNAVDALQRAQFSETADSALRRMARDIRQSVPNTLRVTQQGTVWYLEFLHARSGGRYRHAPDPGVNCSGVWVPGCDPLSFDANDTSFEVLGPAVEVASGDQVVIYSLNIPGANAYSGVGGASDIRRALDCTNTAGCPGAVNRITLTSTNPFPLDAPDSRFFVLDTPVTYICAPNPDGSGTLTRVWNYSVVPGQPVSVPAGASTALLATHVTACSMTYTSNAVAQRNALVTLSLTLGASGNSGGMAATQVSLYHAVHISNVP